MVKSIKLFANINMQGGDTEKCWPWTKSLNKSDGRPYFTVDGVKRPAYVWVLEAHTGEAADGRSALHSCDNETCCNPYHLRWGTHAENMADMVERERHGVPGIVRKAIRKLVVGGRTQEEVAELYGLSQQSVSRICGEKEQEDGDERQSNTLPRPLGGEASSSDGTGESDGTSVEEAEG